MLPAGVTDTVHGDVGGGGDGADGPRPWFIDDDNYTEYPLSLGGCAAAAAAADDDGDNLSIDLDTFYSLLDNEQPVSSSFQEDVLQANQEKASPPQDGISEAPLGLPLEVEEHEHSQCPASHDLDAYKQGNGLVSSYEASECPESLDVCNQSSEYVKPHDSHLIDTSSSMSHAANWLSLSTSGYKNSLVDSTGCSVVPTVSGFEYQQLQTQSPETLSSDISEYKSIHGSQHAVPGKNFHLGCKKREVSVHGDGESLDVAAVFCKDKTFVSSSNHLQQSQAADSSHFMSVVTYSFGSVHNDVCTNAMLNRGRQEENTCSTAVDSCNDLGANSPNMLNVDMNDLDSYSPNVHNAQLNNGWAAEMTWNAWSNLPVTMNSPPEVYAEASAENTSTQFLPGQLSQSFISSDRQYMINGEVKEEDQGHVSSGGCTGDEVKPFLQPEDASFLDSDSSLSEMSCNGTNHLESINPHCTSYADSLQVCFSTNYTIENGRHLADSSESLLADSQLFIQNKKQNIYSENAEKDQLLTVSQRQFHPAKSVSQIPPKDLSGHSMNVDEDPDICIIDGNNVNYLPCPAAPKKSYVAPPYYPRTSSSRCQADDGNLTFQIALQDLAQPKSEASPPEGVLAVPLLRHQRIALSWMVQKETHSLPCSGGILADDQGLGKTVSTIALILMERSPSSKSCTIPAKGEFEALNLDDDDDFPNSDGLNQGNSNMQVTEGPLKSANTPVRQKGRPAAGTLVVCPTSVLRQWADELRNKVTSEANLSFLVYHGSNRTRDPYELAKYDVVLTTYSIVSMEVAMRSTADKSNGKGRPDTMGASFNFSVGKKRKDSPRNLKASNTVDGSLLESTARPLARVGWFRVILDEAQTIKNHRTQVARACWGLRAKRRWCLSGTPIQNAVDDLYSYFRFLKYEPFSVYNSFCSKIKIPINRDPAVGYRKLQAVLKTIMLRRTKGTLLDGKPIINLPPKTIMLKKVDFSGEERAFYSRLEAESREKFKGYADAGTVKQNYVNILLMLLRLRQACDHPLLVKGCDSSSVWRSSLEAAKKIPRDKQIELLNSLETCLALCTICNDPPEDAVVAVCGHVYCNQCISEHLTGEDNFCPSVNCKVKLTGVSVFSKATLRSCLSGLPQHDCPGTSEVTELPEANMSNDSSKIKAAVEILQSLQTYNDPGSRSNYCMADAKCTDSTKIACTTASAVCPSDNNDKVCLNSAKCSNASVSEKAIVYSQWTRMLDLLEVRLKSLSIQYRRLDGTMTVVARDKAVKDFNTLPEVTVMIMSLKAASLGLNMVSACHVLLLDLWWNPTTEDQAIDRAHRIGQTRPVTVSRLTVENTVEDRILALQEKKREMVASAFGEDGPGSRQTRLTVEDLRYLFMA